MLKTYTHTTVADTAATLFTVAALHETAVVSIEISSGATGGSLTLTRNDGTSDVFAQTLIIKPSEAVVLDHKMFFEAGHSLKVQAAAAGIQICINASEDEA